MNQTVKGQCVGKFSIQNEINRIIKDQGGKDWAKKIQDTRYREKLRAELRRQAQVLWCDYRVKECHCV